MRKLGLVLLVLGIILSIYSGFNYVTREKVVDIGELEITADKNHNVQWSPYVGIALIVVGGGALLLGGSKK